MLHYLGKINILTCFLLFGLNQITAQELSKNDKKDWFEADKYFEYGDYLNALDLYKKLILKDSNNVDINYNYGICLFKLKRDRNQIKKHFNKVKLLKYKETSYYLGKLYHLDREYDKAISKFTLYKNIKGDKRINDEEVDHFIAKCKTALLLENTTNKNVHVENLGEIVNSVYAEYSPLISVDENKLYFTSRRKNNLSDNKDPLGSYYENIFFSELKGKDWQKPQMMDTTINSLSHDACTGISADGEQLLIYRTSKDGKSGSIFESNFYEGKWGTPKELNQNINSLKYTETSACYSLNGNTVFFSSNRPGGYGGNDLYCVKKLPNGEWGEPFNLGSNINTKYNEQAPFVHPSGSTLYFSSEGHINMGGYDVFKANFLEDGSFETPTNLGYPTNTVNDDIFFVLNADESTGYLSSERAGGFGSHDLYKVSYPNNKQNKNVYKVVVYDQSNNIIKNVDLELIDVQSKKKYGKYKSNGNNGKIIIISESNKEYEIYIKSKGYNEVVNRFILNNDNNLTFKLSKKDFEEVH